MSILHCMSFPKKIKVLSLLGQSTRNAIAYDISKSNIVEQEEVQDEKSTSNTFELKIEIFQSKFPEYDTLLDTLKITSTIAVNLLENEESCFKEIVNFYSSFPAGIHFFFIQVIKMKKKFRKRKEKDHGKCSIERIDYGHQFIIAIPDLKKSKDAKKV